MSLIYISQQLNVYVSILFLLIGLFGNGTNIYIFSSNAAYRTTPTTFYFLIESIFKSLFLLVNLSPRVIGFMYGIDFTTMSLIWCKARQFLLMLSSVTSITCSCLATIDQFFITSSNASLRRLSKIRWARGITMIVVLVWLIHAVPFYLYYRISPTSNTCGSGNPVLTAYIPVYFLLIISSMPISIMIVFGGLTYRNIRRTTVLAEQQADRQITTMTLIQVLLVVFCVVPIGVMNAYSAMTAGIPKDQDRVSKEYLASTVISIEATLYYAASFYTFFLASSRFRQIVRRRLCQWRHANRIVPSQSRSNEHY